MKYSVEDVLAESVVLTGDDGKELTVKRSQLDCAPKAGMIFVLENGLFKRDARAENERREQAGSLLGELLSKGERK